MDAERLAHGLSPAAGEAEGALVLLHGRGVDEHDLFPLLDALDPERRLLGATPRGPLSLPRAGADVTYRESPMPHAIDPAFLRELPQWVVAALSGRGETGA